MVVWGVEDGLGNKSRIRFKIQLVTRHCSVLVEGATRHLIDIGILHVTSPIAEELTPARDQYGMDSRATGVLNVKGLRQMG